MYMYIYIDICIYVYIHIFIMELRHALFAGGYSPFDWNLTIQCFCGLIQGYGLKCVRFVRFAHCTRERLQAFWTPAGDSAQAQCLYAC